MDISWTYYLWVMLLLVLNFAAWCTSLLMIPGNWIMVVVTALFAWGFSAEDGLGIRWATVGVITALAAVGELIELSGGPVGAFKSGASRRAAILAVVGGFAGATVGAVILLPIFFFGPILGALVGGGVGAFLGGAFGQSWKGGTAQQPFEVGRAAMIGHVLAMVAKLLIGAVIFVIVTYDALF